MSGKDSSLNLNPGARSFNPEAKAFSPVGTSSGAANDNNAPAPNTRGPAQPPLPAGEVGPSSISGSSSTSGGGGRLPNASAGAYVPPVRQNMNNQQGPPLHQGNFNNNNPNGPNNFVPPPGGFNNNGPNPNTTGGHGNASFFPSHSAGNTSGGNRFPHPQGGAGNWNNNNNNNFHHHHHHNNNNNMMPHHHHHHHHNNNQFNNNNNNFPHHHNNNMGGNNFNNNNIPPHHHHHNHHNNNNMHHHHHHHHNNAHHPHHAHHHSFNNNLNNMPPLMNPNGVNGGIPPHHHNNSPNIPHPVNNNNMGGGGRGNGGNMMMGGPNNNNVLPNGRGGRGGGGNHHHGGGGGMMLRQQNRKAVVVLGAPKSGKTTLAKRIAKDIPHFHYIEAPLDKEKFETLSEDLKKILEQEKGNLDRMLVLDGFGADHDADLFYLSSVLKRYNFSVFGLVYLNLNTPAKTIKERQEGVAPSTAQMFGHAVAFETCAQYDSSPNLILIDADQTKEAVFEGFKKGWQDAQLVPLEVQAPKVLRQIDRSLSWKMENYGEFKIVTGALERALPATATNGNSPMPLRSAFGPLSYAHFARWFSRLPSYNVSLMTNGQRVVLFAFNHSLYFLPEHGYYVFRYDPTTSGLNGGPVGAAASKVNQWFDDQALKTDKTETTCPLVFDAEYVIFQNEEYILLRDILIHGSEPCYNLPLKERLSKLVESLRQRSAEDTQNSHIQILPHRYSTVDKVHEIFGVWERAEATEDNSQPATKVGVGVRLEPPGEYIIGQHDPNLLYWFDPERIAIVVRLWNVEDDTANDGQKFTCMGVDDGTGLEAKLPKDCPEKVLISNSVIAEEQLGEGHIVELTIRKQLTNPPPASRGGRNQQNRNNQQSSEVYVLEFARRRWDIALPMYHSTISAIIGQVKHSWSREYFQGTCEQLKAIMPASPDASGSATPMTPSSPNAN